MAIQSKCKVMGGFLTCLLIGCWVVVAQETGQSEKALVSEVKELAEGVDHATLVEALMSSIGPPPASSKGSRSLNQPSCRKYHLQKSRGIKFEPVSKRVALKVEFESDSAELGPSAQHRLETVGQVLAELKDSCFWIEGHTDDVNTDIYNLALSERRAETVASYLSSRFNIGRDRLIEQGLGESQPLVEGTSSEARQRNRRVQISNLGYRSTSGDS